MKEASQVTGIAPHILRYWEAKFKMLRPARRSSGQRKYTRKDIETILKIKELVQNRRYSLTGARKALLEEKRRSPPQASLELEGEAAALSLLRETKKELESLVEILRG